MVSNVGVGGALGTDTEDWSSKDIEKTIAINCTYTAKVTKSFVPILRKQSKSFIIVISSIAASPLVAVYAGTKAFDRYFGRSIAIELAQYGIDVQVVEPGGVASNFHPAPVSWNICSPETFAQASLKTLGWERESVPFLPHNLLCFACRLFAQFGSDKVIYNFAKNTFKNKPQ